MYQVRVKLLLISLALVYFPWGTSAQQINICPAFTTQGPPKDQTVIRLGLNKSNANGLDDQRAHEWKVYARTIEDNEGVNVCRIQGQCDSHLHLLAWKSARGLRNELQQSGQRTGTINYIGTNEIEIIVSNVWIEFGIIYTVELNIMRYGEIIERLCFEISRNGTTWGSSRIRNKYSMQAPPTGRGNARSRNGNSPELILIGPDRIFCSSALIINAFVVGTCANVTFQWTLKESPSAAPEILNYQGPRLEVPANTLKNARTYLITCDLLNDNIIMASAISKVSVRKPKFVLRLQNKNQTIGVNQPIKIIAHVDVPCGIQYQIVWTCTKDAKKCGRFSGATTLYIGKGFLETGLYEFDFTVMEIGMNEKLTAYVNVIQLNRSIEFDKVPLWISPTEELQITANMMNVRSGCILMWQSIHNITQGVIDAKYSELDVTRTNYNKTSPIYIKRDAFLKELSAISTETGHSRIALKIQQALLATDRDVKYLLRLSTSCQDDNPNYADMEIVTNAAPVTTSLKVSPLKGDALFMSFRFETTPAKDKWMDLPLTYFFGWFAITNATGVGNITYFTKLQDFYMSDTTLPYIKEANGVLQSVMTVCDNKGSCTTVNGPKIAVTLPARISEENHSTFKVRIRCDLMSNDFERFRYEVLLIFRTYECFSNQFLLEDIQDTLNLLLTEKIRCLLDKQNKDLMRAFLSSLAAIEPFFKPSAEVHKNLLKLHGMLVNKKMVAQIVTDDEREALGVIDAINSKDLHVLTEGDIQNYFKATEFIITTSDDPDLVSRERENFINNMDKYLMELCILLYRNAKKSNVRLELKTAFIVLEKFSSSYFRNFQFVPSPNNRLESSIQIKLNQSWHMQVRDRSMCIGKAVLNGFLGQSGLLYYAKLFNNDMSKFKLKDLSNTIIQKRTPNTYRCSLYSDGAWSQCRNGQGGYLVCMCNKMGYYRISTNPPREGGAGPPSQLESSTEYGSIGNHGNTIDKENGGNENIVTINIGSLGTTPSTLGRPTQSVSNDNGNSNSNENRRPVDSEQSVEIGSDGDGINDISIGRSVTIATNNTTTVSFAQFGNDNPGNSSSAEGTRDSTSTPKSSLLNNSKDRQPVIPTPSSNSASTIPAAIGSPQDTAVAVLATRSSSSNSATLAITVTPSQSTSDLRSAGIASGSFMSLGDQISFIVIGLCVLGTSGLVVFGLISKRVRKSRAANNDQPTFPVYANIFQKENMHGDV